ncbi:MAG: hypothetical protein E3J81_08430 [Dehalococcoidia bacterium]|nr:MAG: hypothetical protein E3J81_08430 [Dehalococcoidia bacterium]
MTIAIRSTSEIAAKFAEVTPQRLAQYAAGVANPKRSWAEATKAAEAIYKEAVIKAANEGRFGKGVAKAGDTRWQERAIKVGPSRFAEGVADAGPRYAEGFDPYRQVIAGLTLPPRGPAGDPRNLERVKVVSMALHKKKLSG